MSFTNINDPAGISALLEQLRSSQAWVDLQARQNVQTPQPKSERSDDSDPPKQTLQVESSSSKNEADRSVASLLSQLNSTSEPGPSSIPSVQPGSSPILVPQSKSPARPAKDFRNYTFQQSLPHLARLSDNPEFVGAVLQLRQDQNNLEKQLWEERQVLHEKQAERVKIAVTKANMLGIGFSEREAIAMRRVFENELSKFDQERVLPAWEGLIARQQVALENLGVPAMFASNDKSDMERQRRIIQVLEGIVGCGEP